MADITCTAAKVARVHPERDEVVDLIAAEAITAGKPVYQTTAGKAGIADANASGKQQARGIALKSVSKGSAVPVLKRGFVSGFDLSGLDADAVVYLSDTAGALATTAGTLTVNCGRVVCMTDPSLTKVLFVDFDWLRTWA